MVLRTRRHLLHIWPIWAVLFCAASVQILEADDAPANLLVLTSGRVVTGRISQSAGGYMVEKSRGSMLIPFDQVALTARDLRDAYQKMRQRQAGGATAEKYLATARWCTTYQLYEEARAELRNALTLDESNAEARLMLKRLDDVLNPGRVDATTSQAPQKTADGFETSEARSLAGLSQDTAREFVTRVQPILLHKCGNASCHGSAAANEFRLTHSRTHRVFAERNLAAVLRYVDLETPEQSRLLTAPQGDHGPGGETIFHGSIGADQLRTLREWAIAAAGDQRNGVDRSEYFPEDERNLSESLLLIRGRPAEIEQSSDPAAAPEQDLLERILQEERKDAFDPDEFNRSFHGGARVR